MAKAKKSEEGMIPGNYQFTRLQHSRLGLAAEKPKIFGAKGKNQVLRFLVDHFLDDDGNPVREVIEIHKTETTPAPKDAIDLGTYNEKDFASREKMIDKINKDAAKALTPEVLEETVKEKNKIEIEEQLAKDGLKEIEGVTVCQFCNKPITEIQILESLEQHLKDHDTHTPVIRMQEVHSPTGEVIGFKSNKSIYGNTLEEKTLPQEQEANDDIGEVASNGWTDKLFNKFFGNKPIKPLDNERR